MVQGFNFAKGETEIALLLKLANRHGLITGATGTGKTVTLRTLAENFSKLGVPVFMADVKGDLAGLCQNGEQSQPIKNQIEITNYKEWLPASFPTILWDVYGEAGHQVRTTISEMGPLLLSRLLNLNDVQSAVLNLVFKIADDEGLPLLDMKDLQAMVQHVGEHAKEYTSEFGNIAPSTIGAIQRGLVNLGEAGGDKFFGEAALEITDFLKTSYDGKGYIHVLAANKLLQSPVIYSTFLLWLISELFEELPETGDLDKPKLVFFFDEAHLLFNDAPKPLLEKIEQVVRLIRSKGVGIYFVTQSPLDIPENVLGQLGNRVQHALRAFTAKDQKAIKAVAENFRSNGKQDLAKIITELKIGEALISVLDASGSPTPAERAYIYPPCSKLGSITEAERSQVISHSQFSEKYSKTIDRESAYEKLKEKLNDSKEVNDSGKSKPGMFEKLAKSVVTNAFSSVARTIGSQIGRQILRGVLGSVIGGARKR